MWKVCRSNTTSRASPLPIEGLLEGLCPIGVTWGGSKSWSSRRPTRKHLSFARFLNCAQNSSTLTWLKSESSISAFNATTEMRWTELNTCSEIRCLSPSLKKSSNDFPDKPSAFGAVWRSIDASWPESSRAVIEFCPRISGQETAASKLLYPKNHLKLSGGGL